MAKVWLIAAIWLAGGAVAAAQYGGATWHTEALRAKDALPSFPWLTSTAVPTERVTDALNAIWSRGYQFDSIEVLPWSPE